MKTLRRRDSMLVITLFLNVPDIETKGTDLETWQGNSFQFCTSQKYFVTFYKNVFQYWKVWFLLSGKDKKCVYSYAGISVCNTLCPVLSILYLTCLVNTLLPPINSILLTFLSGHFGSQLFISNISQLKGGNQNPKPKYICAEWSGDDIQNNCQLLFDCSVIILAHQVGTDQ